MKRFVHSILLVALLNALLCTAAFSAERPLFETDVRPILKAHCWHCHGEETELQGGLDARLVRLLQKGGDSGASIVAGDHAGSLLYDRVASGEMPPGKKKLSADEMQTLATWIDAGAKTARPEPEEVTPESLFLEEDRSHWSFQPIQRPAVPEVKTQELVRSPVDAFLLKELGSKGVDFSSCEDKETLIRGA